MNVRFTLLYGGGAHFRPDIVFLPLLFFIFLYEDSQSDDAHGVGEAMRTGDQLSAPTSVLDREARLTSKLNPLYLPNY